MPVHLGGVAGWDRVRCRLPVSPGLPRVCRISDLCCFPTVGCGR
nr:MAG TPA: hypothetical protein [Caudoviricetes sp.]